MNDKISLYEVLDTSVTNVEKTCEDCGKTQSDFDLSLLDTAIPSSLDTPLIRNMILQSKQKVFTTPYNEVLELINSFPENTVHVIELPHIDPNAKLYIAKSIECFSAVLFCLLINGVYTGAYMATREDAEMYFNHRLCNFESLIDMLEAFDIDAYGELNLSAINNLPVKEITGYVPLIVRKFMAPNNTYDNFSDMDYERFIKWSNSYLNQKLIYSVFPDTHLVIAKTKFQKPSYYLAVKNGDDAYRTMCISIDNSDAPRIVEVLLKVFSDADSAEINLPDRLSFDSVISRTISLAAEHLETLLSNLDN